MLLQLFYFSTWRVSLEISILLGKLNQAFFSTLLDFAKSVKIPIFFTQSQCRGARALWLAEPFKGLEPYGENVQWKEGNTSLLDTCYTLPGAFMGLLQDMTASTGVS